MKKKCAVYVLPCATLYCWHALLNNYIFEMQQYLWGTFVETYGDIWNDDKCILKFMLQ